MNGSNHEISLLLLLATVPYLFLMLRVFSGLLRIEKWNKKIHEKTMVSVVIATNKKASQIAPLLNDLACQDYDHNLFEIVIADDSEGLFNPDHLLKMPDINYKVITNTGTGKKSAMQNGIMAAEGELIMTTDDDCRVGPGWISTIASFFEGKHPDMILCPVELDDNKKHFGRMQQLEFLSLQGVTAGTVANNNPIMCNGAGMAFKRNIFPENGLGESDSIVSGDDIFFLHHIKKKGASIMWIESKEATVLTAPSADLKSFIKQRARWASKAGSYRDTSTLVTGISVLLLSLAITSSLILSIFNSLFIITTLFLYFIKTIPDLIIIQNRLKMHHKEKLLWYFPAVQLIYPFYVLISVLTGIFKKRRW